MAYGTKLPLLKAQDLILDFSEKVLPHILLRHTKQVEQSSGPHPVLVIAKVVKWRCKRLQMPQSGATNKVLEEINRCVCMRLRACVYVYVCVN